MGSIIPLVNPCAQMAIELTVPFTPLVKASHAVVLVMVLFNSSAAPSASPNELLAPAIALMTLSELSSPRADHTVPALLRASYPPSILAKSFIILLTTAP